MSRPPVEAASRNISACSWHALSQVGWRLIVASSAKISRPRLPAVAARPERFDAIEKLGDLGPDSAARAWRCPAWLRVAIGGHGLDPTGSMCREPGDKAPHARHTLASRSSRGRKSEPGAQSRAALEMCSPASVSGSIADTRSEFRDDVVDLKRLVHHRIHSARAAARRLPFSDRQVQGVEQRVTSSRAVTCDRLAACRAWSRRGRRARSGRAGRIRDRRRVRRSHRPSGTRAARTLVDAFAHEALVARRQRRETIAHDDPVGELAVDHAALTARFTHHLGIVAFPGDRESWRRRSDPARRSR